MHGFPLDPQEAASYWQLSAVVDFSSKEKSFLQRTLKTNQSPLIPYVFKKAVVKEN